MVGSAKANFENQLRQIQLETAKTELRLKEAELRARPTFWKGVLTNPVVLGGIITGFITLNSAIVSQFLSEAQREQAQVTAEAQRLQAREIADNQMRFERSKFQSDLVFKAISRDDADAVISLMFFVEAGFLPDYEEKIRKYVNQNLHRDVTLQPRAGTSGEIGNSALDLGQHPMRR